MVDESTFIGLLEPHLPAAYRLAMAMLRSEADAEDALQEAVFKAWRNFRSYKPDLDIKPWLLTIVANQCRTQRNSRWWGVIKLGSDPRLEAVRDSEVAEAAATDLRRAVDQLRHKDRLVLALRYYLDMSYAEMARVLGISAKAARSRTHRALGRVRLRLENEPNE